MNNEFDKYVNELGYGEDVVDEEVIEEQLSEKEINKLADALYKSHQIARSKGDNEVSNIARKAIAELRDLQRKRD